MKRVSLMPPAHIAPYGECKALCDRLLELRKVKPNAEANLSCVTVNLLRPIRVELGQGGGDKVSAICCF
jgi:hypothetical protein